jgi:trans-2,3-dihydro-3-hydroxyanthranilate isomerase
MLQNEAQFGTTLDAEAAMHAVGLNFAEAHQDLSPQIVSTGLPTAIVPVADAGSLARAAPDFESIDALLRDAQPRAGETPTFYLVWVDEQAERARARMFSRAVIGGEDPATGSAAGPLGAYLSAEAGRERIVISQGEEIGRPSVLEVEMTEGRPRVGGGVIPVIEGEVSLP